MIRQLSLGEKSKDIREVLFENGDILMTRLQYEDKVFSLALGQHPIREIGETTDEYAGKTTDDLQCEIGVCLSFTNPKSLNALIHSLTELQKDIFDGKLNGLPEKVGAVSNGLIDP